MTAYTQLCEKMRAEPSTWLVTGVLLLMQLVIIYVPLMQSMFGTEALPLRYWFVTLVIGVAMFLVVEIEKRLTRRFRKTA